MLSLVTDLCDALGVEACSVSLHWRAIMVQFAPCRRCRLVRFSGCFASNRHRRAGGFICDTQQTYTTYDVGWIPYATLRKNHFLRRLLRLHQPHG
ncbi:hypothetical protein PhaeoP97_02337 [Phaeobacter porticola]|uniref:Uncharacterized protein n=1 Tax=Phaeobacter porticola TaxID=1844006 RepID=A0A1L3I6R9_9RHOB|nr:hypothetical protein PhaeoP97_02337 [Phaeobacter porticola]